MYLPMDVTMMNCFPSSDHLISWMVPLPHTASSVNWERLSFEITVVPRDRVPPSRTGQAGVGEGVGKGTGVAVAVGSASVGGADQV